VIVTIMLNYVAFYFLGYLLNANGFHDPTKFGQAVSKPADPNARLPHLFGDSVNTDIGLVIALAATVAVAWFPEPLQSSASRCARWHQPARRPDRRHQRRAHPDPHHGAVRACCSALVGVTQTLGTTNPNNNLAEPRTSTRGSARRDPPSRCSGATGLGHRRGRAAVRRLQRRRLGHAGQRGPAGGHRERGEGGHRDLRSRPAARPGDLPAARPARARRHGKARRERHRRRTRRPGPPAASTAPG